MLSPYRVLDLTNEKGMYCGLLLGGLGADVIKVEPPDGDPTRDIGPFAGNVPDRAKSLLWYADNANKRGVTLDITAASGRELFLELVGTADVVVESFSTGYLDGMGLSYSELVRTNPALVMCSISPFGQTGPYRDYHGSDLICWAMGGLLSQTGDMDKPPVRTSHLRMAYQIGSMDAAWGIVMALFWRGRSGRGQHLDVALRESMVKCLHAAKTQRGSSFYHIPQSGLALRVVWQSQDGHIYIMLHDGELGERENPVLVRWLNDAGIADDFIRRHDWHGFHWRDQTQCVIDRIHGYFERLFGSLTMAATMEEAARRGIVLQAFNRPSDILEHPQLNARGYWAYLEHPELGTSLKYPGRFCLPSGTDCQLRFPAPGIGQHNWEVYCTEMGIPAEEYKKLQLRRVI